MELGVTLSKHARVSLNTNNKERFHHDIHKEHLRVHKLFLGFSKTSLEHVLDIFSVPKVISRITSTGSCSIFNGLIRQRSRGTIPVLE